MKASECKCCVCGKQAVAFWPMVDPDIPPYPYCRKCLDKQKRELIIKLNEIDEKHEVSGNYNFPTSSTLGKKTNH